MRKRRKIVIYLAALAGAGTLAWFFLLARQASSPAEYARSSEKFASGGSKPDGFTGFDGRQALVFVETQLDFGPRAPGSPGHAAFIDWASAEFERAGWQVEIQAGTRSGQPFKNLLAYRLRTDTGRPWVILGAHYDTRKVADQDPDPERIDQPVPGANDGAAGVAVLLELANRLPQNLAQNVWIVLFDVEDQGDLGGLDWSMGAQAFVSALPELVPDQRPDTAVIVDMIGDADLNIFIERSSTPALSRQIWGTAAALGYGRQFIAQPKYSMIDDHRPFLEAGIPAVLLIDFDYPYWHTTADDLDKVSAESLQAVGDTLLAWLQLPISAGGLP